MVLSILQVAQLNRSKRMCAIFSDVVTSFSTKERFLVSSRRFSSGPNTLGKNTNRSERLHQEAQFSQNGFLRTRAMAVAIPTPKIVNASMDQITVSSVPCVALEPDC